MARKKKLKVLIGAGGSGGHLFPAQQLGLALASDCEILFAGYKLEGSPFFAAEKMPYQEITSAPLKRGFISAAWKGFWQSWSLLRSFRPDVVVGFGSYHTFPLLLAATVFRKKIILFEANSTLGKVNRFFYPFVEKVAFQFSFAHKKGVLVPFLPWGRSNDRKPSLEEARNYFGLHPKKTTLLVFGGSQGASFLNQALPSVIDQLQEDLQVIHLTGKGAGPVMYQKSSCVKEFEPEMIMAYTAADMAVCRSGAGTIAELIQHRVPALLIPFPKAAENHQKKNGEFLIEKTKGAHLLVQSEASPDRLAWEIKALLGKLADSRLGLEKYALQKELRIDLATLVRLYG